MSMKNDKKRMKKCSEIFAKRLPFLVGAVKLTRSVSDELTRNDTQVIPYK